MHPQRLRIHDPVQHIWLRPGDARRIDEAGTLDMWARLEGGLRGN